MSPTLTQLRRALPLLLFLLTAAVFVPTIWFEFLPDWDDGSNVLDHDSFRGFGAEQLGWMLTARHMGHWHPLTWLSFAIDDAIAGRSAAMHHATNVLLHALNAVVCQRVLLRVLQIGGHREGIRLHLAASVAALLWALHPLRVESVAWITERRDVLSGLFFLLTILCWLRRGEGRRWYLLALAAYAASLLSKAWGITMPVLLLLLAYWPLRSWHLEGWRPRGIGRVAVELIPFVLLALAVAAIAATAQAESGAKLAYEHYGLSRRLLQACYGLWFYPLATLFPFGLSPLHELWPGLDLLAPEFLLAAAGTAAVALAMPFLLRSHPAVATMLLLYAVTVSPVLGLHQSGPQLVADRYSYLATIPFFGAAAALLAVRPGWLRASPLLLALLAVLTIVQSTHWRDSKALWRRILHVDPQSAAASFNLARLLINEGVQVGATDRAAAQRMWLEAKRLLETSMVRWPREADALSSYGIVLLNLYGPHQGYELGLPWWLRALERNPQHPDARNMLQAARQARPDLFK